MQEYIFDAYETIDIFKYIIYEWYQDNKRKFPWRETNNPYFILISEMMLQRTKAEQVAGVYEKFINVYSTIRSLVKSKPEQIESIVKSLGLKDRYKVFINAANFILDNYNGILPDERNLLLCIPGVGEYVSGMVMNCAFNKREYVVDTNIARIFNRILDLNLKGEVRRKKEIIKYACIYFDTENSRQYAYAILDFAAAICKSIDPLCDVCPVNKYGLCKFVINIKE
ncbi:hypothetical protein [Clostridium tyrobutyricum]|uniref:hypothetical protein n=1 Tax=Clostridium tyrobutyricum TaxID=1519 RepID=UPI001C39572E|nr:hypothetical protein [Clostridium tyrobutyricum]MBV4414666.1 hypothetical protein [Clostridium tyrobutyricum]